MDEFAQKRSKVERRHAEQAFKWIYENDKEYRDIWYHDRRPGDNAIWFVRDDESGRKYFAKETARLAYLFARKEAGDFSEEPPFANEWKSNPEMQYGTWDREHSRQMWRRLGFSVERYGKDGKMIALKDAVVFSVRQRYRDGMPPEELYEAARGEWRIPEYRREQLKYAIISANMRVKSVYCISGWHPASDDENKWVFSGNEAEKSILDKCLDRAIKRFYGGNYYYTNMEEFMDGKSPPEKQPESEENMTDENIKLLRQFNQIVLYGPPGTGKTHTAKEIVAGLLREHKKPLAELQQKGYWDIVQFHPSYNYEDFVRGVQVNTKDNKVFYETENRTFGKICERAQNNRKNDYALIIDEINRANVSAVLGELIYALEYRGEAVKTPYLGDITIPKNLYIIGTMNTADRTIGQIDYAVRRRFAFVECPPNEGIVKNATAQDFFRRVDAIFNGHISADFDAADVRIGHSYFMAEGATLANKIIYQVIPILREYVKDGVLQHDAKMVIDEIENDVKKLLADEPQEGGLLDGDTQKREKFYYWEKGGRRQVGHILGRIALAVIKDFIGRYPNKSGAELSAKLSSLDLGQSAKRVALSSGVAEQHKDNYFPETVQLKNGDEVLISREWGASGTSLPRWNAFKEKMSEYGYTIGQYHLVNIDPGHCVWEDCHRLGLVVAGGQRHYRTEMEALKKNDIVFAYCPGDSIVAYGKITNDTVNINQFRVRGDLLAGCMLDNGQTYRDKYPEGFEGTEDQQDYVAGVEWLAILPSEKHPLKLKSAPRQARIASIEKSDFDNLCAAFNLNGGDSEE
ncbi:MAG: McrB family protein [Gammaproteobacteria bacterium]